MARKFNFYAGPATLPLPVLERLRDELVDYQGSGLSMIETSHRSKMYDAVHNETVELFREMLQVPGGYHLLFLGGGATLQFAMVPLNFLRGGGSCDFLLSGSWAKKAQGDAQKYGTVRLVYDGSEHNFTRLPQASSVKAAADAAYLHLTSNETIGGVQWKEFPDPGSVPMIADMSSDILSRRIPVERFSLIYAGAQKNLAPAGVTLVIIKEELLEKCPPDLPAYLNYKTHAEKNSLYNTPPVFSVYAMNRVLKWVKDQGGLAKIQRLNEEKAGLIYQAMEKSGGFYSCPVDPQVRSLMNVVFRLPSEELEKQFVQEAEGAGMLGLKGHRSVGGCRASLYNAMPLEGARALADFMAEFARRQG